MSLGWGTVAAQDVRTRGDNATGSQPERRTFSGRILDETGNPVIGATVRLVDRSNGATLNGGFTDAQGRYTLTTDAAAANLNIQVSYVGLADVSVPAQASLDLTMKSKDTEMDEVVITSSYTSTARRNITAASSTVSAEALRDAPITGIDQALQGRAAGVQVFQNSGTPGGGITVQVRGQTSISGGNQPLYVVDGIPITSVDPSQLGFGGQTINTISDISPQDIASMEVLQDAAATALYGSRGSNGVVLITTKRGSASKTTVDYSFYIGTQEQWRKPSFTNGNQYEEILFEALENDGYISSINPDGTVSDVFGDTYLNKRDLLVTGYYFGAIPNGTSTQGVETNWFDEVFREAQIMEHTLSVRGGTEKTRFSISSNYFDQYGIIIGSRFQRVNGTFNLDHKVSDRFDIAFNSTVGRSIYTRIISDNTLTGPFANAIAAAPIWPVRDPLGRFTRPNNFYTNPVAEGTLNDDKAYRDRVISSVTAKFRVIDGLYITSRIGLDILDNRERRYTPDTYLGSSATATRGSGVYANTEITKWVIENFANYSTTISTDHNIDALLGWSRELNTQNVSNVSGQGFPGERFRYISSAAIVNSGTNSETYWGIESVFGQLRYNYKGRYYIDGSIRADGATRFGDDNKWGYFPAASVAWRIKEEAFLKDVNFLSEFRVRASWGITGNWEIGNFAYRNFYTAAAYNDVAGINPTQIGLRDLSWEQTTQYNLGIDIGAFDGRVNFTLDWFLKETEDLLFGRPIAQQSGFGAYQSNIGSMENKGIAFSVSGNVIRPESDGFGWFTNLNMTFIRNKITDLYQDQDVLYGFGANSLILREGQPLGTFYGWISDGVYARTSDVPASRQALGVRGGDINWRDINGDGIITDDDLTIIGDAQPDFTGGWQNNFTYKGIELSIFLQYSVGNEIWNANGQYTYSLGNDFNGDNMRSDVMNRWRREGDVTDMPRATTDDFNDNNRSNSSRFVEDGSYLRIKNVSLSYTFPKEWIEAISLRNLRVFIQAQNLATFTNYSGFDPEVNFAGTSNTTRGVDFYTFPQARTLSVGVNLGF